MVLKHVPPLGNGTLLLPLIGEVKVLFRPWQGRPWVTGKRGPLASCWEYPGGVLVTAHVTGQN